jgi:hypothetical protein
MANLNKQNGIFRNRGYIKANEGFLIGPQPPNALLLHYTNWHPWSPTVISGTESELVTSVGTLYKRFGNQVHLLLSVQFVYDPPGAATKTITLGNLPLAAATGQTYNNNAVMDFNFSLPPVIEPGVLRIDPSVNPLHLVVENSFTYVDSATYTLHGEIVYLTDAF